MTRWTEDYFGDPGTADVADMHEKFGLTLNRTPTELRKPELQARWNFLLEELNEMRKALDEENFEDIIDALIDLVVVAKGTAVMMGIKWQPHWEEVMRANMAKKRGPHNPRRGQDLLKPPGWERPDHRKVLDTYL